MYAILFFSCSHRVDNAISRIDEKEKQFKVNSLYLGDKVTLKLIEAYKKFHRKYTSSDNAPAYLLKAANINVEMENFIEAIKLLQMIYLKYPTFKKTPYCLFYQGFLYENKLNEVEKAEKIYLKFIEEYPNNSLTEDAKYSLKNINNK